MNKFTRRSLLQTGIALLAFLGIPVAKAAAAAVQPVPVVPDPLQWDQWSKDGARFKVFGGYPAGGCKRFVKVKLVLPGCQHIYDLSTTTGVQSLVRFDLHHRLRANEIRQLHAWLWYVFNTQSRVAWLIRGDQPTKTVVDAAFKRWDRIVKAHADFVRLIRTPFA